MSCEGDLKQNLRESGFAVLRCAFDPGPLRAKVTDASPYDASSSKASRTTLGSMRAR
jgi:hypothetical protein